jgi:hypothetical protein
VEPENAVGGMRVDLLALLAEAGGDPRRLHRDLGVLDVRVAPRRVGEDQPDQSRPGHEPHDQQPPVELGVHRRIQGAPTRGEAVESGNVIRRPV